jgi:hypothetical protein
MAKAAVLGDPLDPATMIGPIATRSEYDKILGYIESGKQSPAKLVAGGGTKKINGKGLFIEPTLFANATNDLKISREEIFGPVLPIIPFEGEIEAIRLANDTSYGLASGIQTGDLVGAGNLVPPEMRPQIQQYIDALKGTSPQEVLAAAQPTLLILLAGAAAGLDVAVEFAGEHHHRRGCRPVFEDPAVPLAECLHDGITDVGSALRRCREAGQRHDAHEADDGQRTVGKL